MVISPSHPYLPYHHGTSAADYAVLPSNLVQTEVSTQHMGGWQQAQPAIRVPTYAQEASAHDSRLHADYSHSAIHDYNHYTSVTLAQTSEMQHGAIIPPEYAYVTQNRTDAREPYAVPWMPAGPTFSSGAGADPSYAPVSPREAARRGR